MILRQEGGDLIGSCITIDVTVSSRDIACRDFSHAL